MDLSLAAVSTWHPPNLHRPHLDSSSPNQSFQTSTFHNKKTPKVTKICSPATNPQILNPHISTFFSLGFFFHAKREPKRYAADAVGLVRNFSRWQKGGHGVVATPSRYLGTPLAPVAKCDWKSFWEFGWFGFFLGKLFTKVESFKWEMKQSYVTDEVDGWYLYDVKNLQLTSLQLSQKAGHKMSPVSDVHLRCQTGEMFSWTAMILCPIWRCKSCWFVLSNHQF